MTKKITIKNIHKKIQDYIESVYGEIDFKEILLYSLSEDDLKILCKVIEDMPNLPKTEENALVKIFKLYNHFNNIEIIESETDAAILFEKMNIDIAIVSLVKANRIQCTDINNGNWKLELAKDIKFSEETI